MPPWIAPRLRCGLGNRLFQILAAIGESERRGTEPVFFLPRMSHYEHGDFSLVFKLVPLRLVETAHEWKEGDVLEEGEDDSLPLVLSGFFQDSSYFPSLTNPLWPRLPPSDRPLQQSWAVHFRLGDYTSLPHHQIPNLAQYYAQTLQTHVPPGSSLLLFSDSPEALPAIQTELRGLGYVPTLWDSTDVLQTFQAFSSCECGAICSNSTFAWWAAYFLWKRTGASSYFPDIWIRDQPTPKILTLPFTRAVSILHESPKLESFSYHCLRLLV
jgi:hypothetical protein